MAIIKSGATSDELTIDATSKAARSSLYTTTGALLHPEYAGSYVVRIEIIPTTLTAATTYFAMRNLGTRRIFLRKLELKMGFSGTVAATRSLYEIERFSAATPTGGTALAAIKKDNTHPASSASDIRYAPGGLTMAGVSFEAAFQLVGNTNQLTIDHAQDIDFTDAGGETSRFVLAVNEGLAIRANVAIVLGSYLVGSITWDERT